MATKDRAAAQEEIAERFGKLKSNLTERARRLFAASEAVAFGHGGIVAASAATRLVPSVIGKGIKELQAIERGSAPVMPPTRSRRPGGGRKKATERTPRCCPI